MLTRKGNSIFLLTNSEGRKEKQMLPSKEGTDFNQKICP